MSETRFHSESLNLPTKVDNETGIVTVKDRLPNHPWVTYSREECRIISEKTGVVSPEVHKVKKIFIGTIVKFDSK